MKCTNCNTPIVWSNNYFLSLCLSKGNSNVLANEFHPSCAWAYNYVVQAPHQLIKWFHQFNFTMIQTLTHWSIHLKSGLLSGQWNHLDLFKWMAEYIQDHSLTYFTQILALVWWIKIILRKPIIKFGINVLISARYYYLTYSVSSTRPYFSTCNV